MKRIPKWHKNDNPVLATRKFETAREQERQAREQRNAEHEASKSATNSAKNTPKISLLKEGSHELSRQSDMTAIFNSIVAPNGVGGHKTSAIRDSEYNRMFKSSVNRQSDFNNAADNESRNSGSKKSNNGLSAWERLSRGDQVTPLQSKETRLSRDAKPFAPKKVQKEAQILSDFYHKEMVEMQEINVASEIDQLLFEFHHGKKSEVQKVMEENNVRNTLLETDAEKRKSAKKENKARKRGQMSEQKDLSPEEADLVHLFHHGKQSVATSNGASRSEGSTAVRKSEQETAYRTLQETREETDGGAGNKCRF